MGLETTLHVVFLLLLDKTSFGTCENTSGAPSSVTRNVSLSSKPQSSIQRPMIMWKVMFGSRTVSSPGAGWPCARSSWGRSRDADRVADARRLLDPVAEATSRHAASTSWQVTPGRLV